MTDTLRLDGPVEIMVTLGLTLPSISEAELDGIRLAAPPGSVVRVAATMREAFDIAGETEVLLGIIPKTLFDAAPKLRWVHCIASGMDMFLYPEMRASPVVLTGEKGLVGGHLADTGFGLLLALTRQIATAIRLGPEGWDRREAMRMVEIELDGLTLGVVGFGGTGRAMAPTCRGLRHARDRLRRERGGTLGRGDRGVDHGPPRRTAAHERCGGHRCSPHRRDPRGLFDDTRFAAMKPGALLVNVTRGEIVDGDALVRALRSGRLGGAALDVAPIEPLPADHPLWTFDNVVMTPHTAGASQLRGPRNIARFCENLRRAGAR